MKILYLGTYREKSGWGEAARQDLTALTSGFDVVSRPIVYSKDLDQSYFGITEGKSVDKSVTHVIQYCLPSQWRRYGTMKHIGYVEIESYDISHSLWTEYFNMVDEIWCPNEDGAATLRKETSLPVKVMPHAIDTLKYKNTYKISEIPEIQGTFKLLCVSENIPRKNLGQLIEEYFINFDANDQVSLILKSNSGVNNLIQSIKEKLRIYTKDAYRKIILIDDVLTEEQMFGLYQESDVYVNPSMGESWSLPVVHAIGFNKPVISIDRGGPKDLLANYPAHINLESSKYPCQSVINFIGYQTAQDYWYKPEPYSIVQAMSIARENKLHQTGDYLEQFSTNAFLSRVLKELSV
jgi:glycosyltransferase involved in cell wall biosynthesis